MYYWLEQLIRFKKESGKSYASIAENTDIPTTTIEKMFGGRTKDPKLNTVNKIVTYLGHSVQELVPYSQVKPDGGSEDASRLLNAYCQLDAATKNMLLSFAEYELRRKRMIDATRKTYPTIYYDFPVSAGTGEFLDSTTASILHLSRKPPHGTDFILRVAGDSMEPDFHDNDLVYVEKTDLVDFGEIGIFIYNGSVYMKEYTMTGLRSLNEEYALIPGNPDIRCLGRVIKPVNADDIVAD